MAKGYIFFLVSLALPWSSLQVEEPKGEFCTAFENIPDVAKANAPDGCRLNDCPGGCCRVYNYLQCDEKDEFPHLKCVCNENTATRPPTTPPTAAPTETPSSVPTASPSTFPSEQPTDEDRSGGGGDPICSENWENCVGDEFCCSGLCWGGRCRLPPKDSGLRLPDPGGNVRGGAAGRPGNRFGIGGRVRG